MQTSYNGIAVPADGKAIEYTDGKYTVPDNPIIPFIEGDGTGRDIWKASQRVFDAAVEKAYGGKRKVAWFEVLAGEKAYRQTQNWLPDDTVKADGRLPRLHQGTADHARRRRHPLPQRRAAPVDGPLPVRAPGEVLRRRAQPGEAPREARRRHLPREHRRHLRRHRVPRGHARSREVHLLRQRRHARRAARRRSAPTPASASSPSPSPAPSAWCARPSSTPSTTAARP